MDKLWKLLGSGAFWGSLTATLGALDYSQLLPVFPPKVGAAVAVVGLIVTTFSRALHDALAADK